MANLANTVFRIENEDGEGPYGNAQAMQGLYDYFHHPSPHLDSIPKEFCPNMNEWTSCCRDIAQLQEWFIWGGKAFVRLNAESFRVVEFVPGAHYHGRKQSSFIRDQATILRTLSLKEILPC